MKKTYDAIEQCDPEKPQQKTNLQKITEYMEFGNPLRQAFVIEACSRYADQLLKDMTATRKAMADSFINPNAWLDCAQQWRDQVQPKNPLTSSK